mgnify:CR=1 FL=1
MTSILSSFLSPDKRLVFPVLKDIPEYEFDWVAPPTKVIKTKMYYV